MRGPSALPPGVSYAFTGVRGLPRGSYLRAVCVLTIRELFDYLEPEDQGELVDELVSLLIANPAPDLTNRVANPRGPEGGPLDVRGRPEAPEMRESGGIVENFAGGESFTPPDP